MSAIADTPSERRFSALYVRDFRRYFTGQAISLTGTWMQQTALGWLVYSITGSEFFLGMLGMAMALPVLLFTLFGGILADRFNKKNILMITQLLSTIPALFLAALIVLEVKNIWLILAAALVLGTINAIDIPARQSFTIEIAGRENLEGAVALNSTVFHTARLVGPAIAGFIIAGHSMLMCFVVNALSFLPATYVLSKIARPESPGRLEHPLPPDMSDASGQSSLLEPSPCRGPSASRNGIFGKLAQGFSFIKNDRQVAALLLTLSVMSLFGIPFSQFLPVYADRVFHAGPRGLGYLMSAVGGGSALAGFFIAFKGNGGKKLRFMSCTGALFPLSLMSFTVVDNFYAAMFFLALTGFNVVGMIATANSFIQLRVSDELRGRVMSVFAIMLLGMTPIGAAMMGIAADVVGLKSTLMAGAAICLTGFFILRRWWCVEAPPDIDAQPEAAAEM
jgi:MFS family permease